MTQPARIRLLGDPILRARAADVESFDAGFRRTARLLAATLDAFRASHGFGRAIAAPQIGIPQRLIAVNLGEGTFLLANPVVTWRSRATFTMWDDCMSFPDLLVRVKRAKSISLQYADEQGVLTTWDDMPQPVAELLQHEIDHLDGILAIDRAVDRESIVLRSVFESDRARFEAQVDYVIAPTIPPIRTHKKRARRAGAPSHSIRSAT